MRFGIFNLIGLATTLVFALPVANVGVIRLLAGETVYGGALIGIAIAMVVLPQFFFDPGRILKGLLYGLLPKRVTREQSTSAESESGSDDVDGAVEK